MISKCLLLDKQSKCPAYFSNMKGVDVANFCGHSYSHCISLQSTMMFLNGILVRLLIHCILLLVICCVILSSLNNAELKKENFIYMMIK